jgi:hypothetical protein
VKWASTPTCQVINKEYFPKPTYLWYPFVHITAVNWIFFVGKDCSPVFETDKFLQPSNMECLCSWARLIFILPISNLKGYCDLLSRHHCSINGLWCYTSQCNAQESKCPRLLNVWHSLTVSECCLISNFILVYCLILF